MAVAIVVVVVVVVIAICVVVVVVVRDVDCRSSHSSNNKTRNRSSELPNRELIHAWGWGCGGVAVGCTISVVIYYVFDPLCVDFK